MHKKIRSKPGSAGPEVGTSGAECQLRHSSNTEAEDAPGPRGGSRGSKGKSKTLGAVEILEEHKLCSKEQGKLNS